MRFHLLIFPVIALFAAGASAITAQKAVIVTYPDDTPDSVLTQAMDAIRDAGGIVTHEYSNLALCYPPK